MLYCICLHTPDEYPFLNYFKSQYIVREYGESGNNPHWQGIVNLDPSKKEAAIQQIKRWTTKKNQYSFVLVRNPLGLKTYLAKEGHEPVVSTFDLNSYLKGESYTKSMTPKVTHKKGETFIQYVLKTWVPSPPDITINTEKLQEQHVLQCFITMEMEISKTKYRNALTTLRFHFPCAKSHMSVPRSWTEMEK